MRKIALFLAFCLMFMNITAVAAENDIYKDTLRVGVAYGSGAMSEVWVYSESPIDVTDANYMSYITTIPAFTRVRIYVSGGVLTSDYFAPITSSVSLQSLAVIYINDSGYRGSFELRCDSEKISVINTVKTEHYLASLLGKEMSSSWPIEALKAQAVCARNYALTIAGKHSSDGFDICATTHCQVYGGIESESDKTLRAVDETKGVIVTYQGKVVPLYYFSCDGGYTENSENVWVSAEGYLRGKKDIYESEQHAKLYSWSKTLTKEEIESILNSKNMSVGELLDIRIDEMSENNGVIKLTFVGTEGEKTITKTQTRTVLSLNSQAYTIEKHAAEPVVREEPVVITECVLTANGVVSVVNPAYAMTGEGTKEIPYGMTSVEEEADSYATYTFNGHGWGHLVGMSQWGAYSMALSGYTYKDILSFYYTDIVIEESQFETEAVNPGEEDTGDDVTDETYDEIQRNDTGI